ncbi:MAG: potassium channel protein [Verrucomicrobiae bacterium]|nr:potassium channel protein [Verrucomicrobiae bacterium]
MLLFALIAIGTIGFVVADPEHSLFHAFYLTLIVLTTVGMEAAEGHERIVASILMIGGIFTTIYAAGTLVTFIVDGELTRFIKKRKLMTRISKFQDHYLVVGFGRMGRALCATLQEKGVPFVLIERDPKRLYAAEELGYAIVQGDAHDEKVYETAGIERAKGLATCLPGDADNVYVTLTARGFSEDLNIIARAEDERTHTKLIRAGADRVVCPPVLSAGKAVAMMVTPIVDHGPHCDITSPDTPIELFNAPIEDFPVLLNKPLAENHVRTRTGMTVVAIDRGKKRDLNPTALFTPQAGDQLVLVGPPNGMKRMAYLFGPKSEAALAEAGV